MRERWFFQFVYFNEITFCAQCLFPLTRIIFNTSDLTWEIGWFHLVSTGITAWPLTEVGLYKIRVKTFHQNRSKIEICRKKKQLESSVECKATSLAKYRTYFQSLTLYSPLVALRKLVLPHSGAPKKLHNLLWDKWPPLGNSLGWLRGAETSGSQAFARLEVWGSSASLASETLLQLRAILPSSSSHCSVSPAAAALLLTLTGLCEAAACVCDGDEGRQEKAEEASADAGSWNDCEGHVGRGLAQLPGGLVGGDLGGPADEQLGGLCDGQCELENNMWWIE